MKSIGLIAMTFITFATISGCISLPKAEFAPAKIGDPYLSRTAPDKIELYRSQLPARNYVEIGSVSACCLNNTEKLIEMLRTEASDNGGDAIIGLDLGAQGSAMATVVRYK